MNIGSKIKKSRLDSALTQSEFSQLTGFSRNTISRWERGVVNPRSDELEIICKQPDIPMEVFMEDTIIDSININDLNQSIARLNSNVEDLVMAVEDMKLELVTVNQLKKTMRKSVIIILIGMIFLVISLFIFFYLFINWPAHNDSQPIKVEYMNTMEDIYEK